MTKLLHPLLLLIAGATARQLARHVQHLKEENRILRAKCPERILVTAKERLRLLRFGRPVGAAIKDLITIVSPRTFARWVNGEAKGTSAPKKPGRPKTERNIQELVLKLARETGRGYTRIQGELLKRGVRKVSLGTIARILKDQGLDPDRSEATRRGTSL